MAVFFCPKCGREIRVGEEVCTCGQPLKKVRVLVDEQNAESVGPSLPLSEEPQSSAAVPQPESSADAAQDAVLSQASETPKKRHYVAIIVCIVIFALLVGCVALLATTDSSSSFVGNEYTAIRYAKQAVENNLKSPSTASFCSDSAMKVVNTSGDSYTVSGYVDAQNSFGATVRQYFIVELTLTSSGARNVNVTFVNS